MRTAVLATLALILTATVLPAQSTNPSDTPSPFGLRMGMTKEKLDIAKEVSPFKYQLASVSKPHNDLEVYVVTITPKAGLCFIRTLSTTWQTKSDGTELKARFEDMKSQLAAIYGKPHLVDTLQPDSKRTRPRDWMESLLEKERTLVARWSAIDDSLPMLPTISKIYVGAYALSPTSGYLVVEYYFTNYAQCFEEINPAGSGK